MENETSTTTEIGNNANLLLPAVIKIQALNKKKEQIRILVSKVKFKHLGIGGDAIIKYNFINGRFEDKYAEVKNYNNSCYIGYGTQQDAFGNNKTDENEIPF